MSSLCIAGDGVTAALFATALHFGWTPADGVAREESWHLIDRQFVFMAARTKKGTEWEHSWPARAPQKSLRLDRRGLRTDYVLCGEMWCRPLEQFVPRSRAAVVDIAPC